MTLFQELVPAISIEHLEIDKVHQALAPRQTDSPPCDIIARLHFYLSKEQLKLPKYHATTEIPLWVALESVECGPLSFANHLLASAL